MTDRSKRSISQRWDDLQPSKTVLVWSCAGCVAVALVAGFTWGGWVTGGTAQKMAGIAGDTSRYELASVICVERFLEAADARAQLTALKAIDSSYAQRQFVEDGGWATMPSKDKAARQTADLCAKVLSNLDLDASAEADGEGKVQPTATAQ